jgi:hypothetical protein
MAEAMYRQTGSAAGSGAGASRAAPPNPEPNDDDVIDAEFRETA